jgi:hypothetical protein
MAATLEVESTLTDRYQTLEPAETPNELRRIALRKRT